MSKSPLVCYTNISPNKNSPRNHSIDRISPHCVVGQASVETIGNIFAAESRGASSNYGIGFDGKIGCFVDENDRSWCSSSPANDHRAITVEIASDTKHPYEMTSAAYSAFLDLATDICKRHGKKKLLWISDKAAALDYEPKSDEMLLTVHRWFAAKSCPGDWLYSRLGDVAAEVTKRLINTASVVCPNCGHVIGSPVPAETPKPVEPAKTIEILAREVIQGKWGNGGERKIRLTEAGYDYAAVQALVNKLLS